MELFHSKVIISFAKYDDHVDNPIDDDDDQDNPANDDVDDQGRGGGSGGSTWLPAPLTFPERQVHPLLLSCPRCQQVITGFKDDEAQSHCDRDHVISQEDFDDLNDRVRHYMDWSTNNMNYQTLKEVRQSSANAVVEPAQSAED